MSQDNLSFSSYQLRISLRRTSPHVWRRVVVPGHFTLTQLHQTVCLLFGWSNAHPSHFVIRGKSFAAAPAAAGESVDSPPLSAFQFYARERFLYDYRFELQIPVAGGVAGTGVSAPETEPESVVPIGRFWRHLLPPTSRRVC
jgi:hypothetical protein